MKKFNWKLAQVTLVKTFVTTFLTPFVGVTVVFNPELIQTIYVSVFSSMVMCGIVTIQILDRYMKFIQDNNTS